MLVCLDVHYRSETTAVAAAVAFEGLRAERGADASVVLLDCEVSSYQPGEFYRRELPCLLAVLGGAPFEIEALVIDGYVQLDPAGRPGLGAHLYDALGGVAPVIGVAKTQFRPATHAIEVLRGSSAKGLWVTAIGMDATAAAEHVRAMHGEHRMPVLLREVDRLCRAALVAVPWEVTR